jgi:hypothetical protein
VINGAIQIKGVFLPIIATEMKIVGLKMKSYCPHIFRGLFGKKTAKMTPEHDKKGGDR